MSKATKKQLKRKIALLEEEDRWLQKRYAEALRVIKEQADALEGHRHLQEKYDEATEILASVVTERFAAAKPKSLFEQFFGESPAQMAARSKEANS